MAFFLKLLPGLMISIVLAVLLNIPLPSATPHRSPSHQDGGGQRMPVPCRTGGTRIMAAHLSPGRLPNNPIFTGLPVRAEPDEMSGMPPPPARSRSVVAAEPAPRGTWPSNALASLGVPGGAEACPPPPPPYTRTHYMELPAKGIYAWVDGETATASLKKSRNGLNAFDSDEKTYCLGLKYDWSIDSVVGVSIGRLEADVESRRPGDTRRNKVRGTLFSGHYDGYLFGKYPLALRAAYGTLDMNGGGTVDGFRWREDGRDADYYALSATFGVPLIFRDRFKILAETGFDYRKLKTGGYAYTVDGRQFTAPGVSSESLIIPFDVTVRWDMPQVWGILTPYAGCGLAVELRDSATGVRAWNAPSASAGGYSPGPGPVPVAAAAGYDAWKSVIGTVALGVEARTVGGWEVRAGYRRGMASGFAENRFSMELGRCF